MKTLINRKACGKSSYQIKSLTFHNWKKFSDFNFYGKRIFKLTSSHRSEEKRSRKLALSKYKAEQVLIRML